MTDENALAQLRSELLLRLTELGGDVRLILQRMDQQDARAEEHKLALAALDGRVDTVERTAVTREELDAREARTRAEMDEQARRRLTVMGLIVAVAAALLSSGITVVGIVVSS